MLSFPENPHRGGCNDFLFDGLLLLDSAISILIDNIPAN